MLAIYQTGFHSLPLPDSSGTPQGQKGIESGQKGSKWIIFWCALVFYREFRRPKRAKVKYILVLRIAGLPLWLSLWVCSVPLPCLCPLSYFACRVACEYGFISHFKGVFRGFWGVLGRSWVFVLLGCFAWIVGLLCAWIVRRLKGLWRICPYFFLFSSSSPIFCGFAFVVLGLFSWLLGFCSWSCLFSLCGLLLFLFPLRMCAQKERAQSVVPCVLSCLVVGLLWVYYMLSAFLSVVSFAFENIHPAPQVRWALNLPPRVFSVSLISRVSPTIAIAFSE